MSVTGVSYVEREQANPATNAFYDKAEDRFEMLLNIFKVFGHTPELGVVFTDLIMAILKDGELDWVTKELIILQAGLEEVLVQMHTVRHGMGQTARTPHRSQDQRRTSGQ